MADIVEKLSFWQTVYPEDQDKPDGHLYEDAQKEIVKLRASVNAFKEYPTLYNHCVKYLKAKQKSQRGKM